MLAKIVDFIKTYSGYAATLEPIYLWLVAKVQANPKTATTTLLITLAYAVLHVIF